MIGDSQDEVSNELCCEAQSECDASMVLDRRSSRVERR